MKKIITTSIALSITICTFASTSLTHNNKYSYVKTNDEVVIKYLQKQHIQLSTYSEQNVIVFVYENNMCNTLRGWLCLILPKESL